MAEAHKFNTFEEAMQVFPDLPWVRDESGVLHVENSKTGETVPVSPGQHIVKIADRYEVHDEAPEKAKTAKAPDAPTETPEPAQEDGTNPNAAGAEQPSTTVPPQYIGAPSGSAEADGQPTQQAVENQE